MIDGKHVNCVENYSKIDRGELRLISETLWGYNVHFPDV